MLFTPYDLKRLDSYASQLVDYHMILDLIPTVAKLYFLRRTDVAISYSQVFLLLATSFVDSHYHRQQFCWRWVFNIVRSMNWMEILPSSNQIKSLHCSTKWCAS